MTYKDYKKWAKEYLQQAKILEKKISDRRSRGYFKSAEEREENERAVNQLYEMRRDCLFTHELLMERAEQIKETGEDA